MPHGHVMSELLRRETFARVLVGNLVYRHTDRWHHEQHLIQFVFLSPRTTCVLMQICSSVRAQKLSSFTREVIDFRNKKDVEFNLRVQPTLVQADGLVGVCHEPSGSQFLYDGHTGWAYSYLFLGLWLHEDFLATGSLGIPHSQSEKSAEWMSFLGLGLKRTSHMAASIFSGWTSPQKHDCPPILGPFGFRLNGRPPQQKRRATHFPSLPSLRWEASITVDGTTQECFSVDRKGFPVKAPPTARAPRPCLFFCAGASNSASGLHGELWSLEDLKAHSVDGQNTNCTMSR